MDKGSRYLRFGLFSKTRPCACILGRKLSMLAMAGLSLCLASCGKQDLPGVAVAQVNDRVITDYQLDRELQLAAHEQGSPTRSGALQTLIDRQLLQDEALRNSLDRDPHVLSAIENAKAQILAQAYLHSRRAYISAPSREELQAYFNRHPEKFSKRKLFHLKEIVLPSSELSGELKSVMDQARSLEDVAAWLDGRRIVYTLARQTRSSADMPEALLARMQDLQAGQMVAVREGDNASLLVIASLQESPLSFETAIPEIERILLEERGRQQGDAALARLRARAQVVYQPDKIAESLASKQHSNALQAVSGMSAAESESRRGTTQ